MPKKTKSPQASRARQLSFFPQLELHHGGDIGQGKRKIARPFDPKRPLHVVLRSTRATGAWSFLAPKHKARVDSAIRGAAKKFGIRIYRYANVGNHCHLLFLAKNRKALHAFLRTIAGRIACLVTGAKKAAAVGKFWDRLVYSRIVSWGREYAAVKEYLFKNLLEATGFWRREGSTGRANRRPTVLADLLSSLARAGVGLRPG